MIGIEPTGITWCTRTILLERISYLQPLVFYTFNEVVVLFAKKNVKKSKINGYIRL